MRTSRVVLLGAVCLSAARLPASGAGPETVGSIVERFEHLTVGDAKQISGLALSSGHFECRLSAGRAAPVLAGEQVVGLYYDGAGTMSYVSADPLEASTFSYNVRKVSSLKLDKTDKGVRVTDGFARVLWLAQGAAVPALEGAAAAPLTDSFAKQREKFRRANGPSAAQEFALRALDSPSVPVVRAEVDGGSGDVVYQLDSEDPAESLAVLRKSWSDDPEMRKHLYPEYLSVQHVGRDPKDPPTPRVVLADVDVDLRASDADRGALTVVETLIPLGRPMSAVRMELERTVYTTFGNNLTTRTEQLRRVSDEKGRELGFVHDRDQVLVQLAEPAANDVPVKLKFEIDGDFLVHPGGDSYWELGTEP